MNIYSLFQFLKKNNVYIYIHKLFFKQILIFCIGHCTKHFYNCKTMQSLTCKWVTLVSLRNIFTATARKSEHVLLSWPCETTVICPYSSALFLESITASLGMHWAAQLQSPLVTIELPSWLSFRHNSRSVLSVIN